jgi:hypothetical protein
LPLTDFFRDLQLGRMALSRTYRPDKERNTDISLNTMRPISSNHVISRLYAQAKTQLGKHSCRRREDDDTDHVKNGRSNVGQALFRGFQAYARSRR